MMSPYQRAKIVVKWLLDSNSEKLGSRQCDNYFENVDGEKVVKSILKILNAEYNINSFEQLPLLSQRYACRSWWIDDIYKEPNREFAFGIALF